MDTSADTNSSFFEHSNPNMKKSTLHSPLSHAAHESFGTFVPNNNPHDPAGMATYGTYVSLAMTLNYIVGTGCFGLPYAFKEAGLALTSFFLLAGLIMAILSINYTIETLARAEGITAAEEQEALLDDNKSLEPQSSPPVHCLSYRKFDFASLGFMFGGPTGRNLVQIVVILYGLVTLWSYASVFASSAASLFYMYVFGEMCNVFGDDPFPGCERAYFIGIFIFSCMVLTLVLMDLGEQVTIQNVLTVYRMMAFVIMLLTLVIKVSSEWNDLVSLRYKSIGMANWPKFGKGFGPTFLAITCQYNLPDSLQPLHSKKDAKFVVFVALGLSSVIYLALGLLGSIAFDNVNPLTTLNWNTYTGCGNGWEVCASKTQLSAILGQLIRFLVLFFPIVNVTSTYPMVGITIGENIFASLPKAVKVRSHPTPTVIIRNVCRLLISVPPLLLAAGFKKLDFIFSLGGLFGFALGLSIPGWFQLKSIAFCRRKWTSFDDAWKTPYTSKYAISSPGFASGFFHLSIMTFIFAAWSLMWDCFVVRYRN